ncbi:MAG: class I SAM-dependent methyltransferase [Gemmatimonadota bacterium]|jgi:ubiquinone/menaquinone biosynthesis C-methylase UbiE
MRPALTPERLRAVYDRAAGRYERWHALATARSDQRGRELVVGWCVKPGHTVLDAGGGTGLTAELAARAAEPGGHVVIVDFSEGMLRQAADRSSDGGESAVSLAMGDIVGLPFREHQFDSVLSTYSVCPLVSPGQGVREMYRVLKPGGLLGVAHSSEATSGIVRWLANRVEDLVWHWPQLSLGCRSVEVLPDLLGLGAELVAERRLGIPLWPFHAFAVRKPMEPASAQPIWGGSAASRGRMRAPRDGGFRTSGGASPRPRP